MALTPEQRRNAQTILSVGQRLGATPKVLKAAIAAGLVESGLRNLPYGDRDSQGVFQQRPSQGWKGLTDVPAAAEEFFQHAIPLRKQYGSAGALAQAVQRSAFPERYQARGGEADALIRSLGGSTGSSPSSGQSVTTTVTPGATSGGGFDPGQGGDQTALLAALLSQPKTPSPVSVPTPAFAQNRYLKVGQSPTIEAPQQQPADMGSLLDALQAQGTDLPAGPSSSAPSVNVHVSGAQKASNAAPAHRSRLLELFYNGPGGVNAKNGQVEPRGFVSGHTDHVHVAAGPKTVAELGRLAEQMGLHVGENPHFGGVNPVHVKGSYHYAGQAVDVSGPPALMRKFDRRVAQLYGLT